MDKRNKWQMNIASMSFEILYYKVSRYSVIFYIVYRFSGLYYIVITAWKWDKQKLIGIIGISEVDWNLSSIIDI